MGCMTMDWLAEVAKAYDTNEPIFFSDLRKTFPQYSASGLYKLASRAIASKKLARFMRGIYYIPTQTIFEQSRLSPAKVVRRKYISDGGEVFGYYSGYTLLNGLGLTKKIRR